VTNCEISEGPATTPAFCLLTRASQQDVCNFLCGSNVLLVWQASRSVKNQESGVYMKADEPRGLLVRFCLLASVFVPIFYFGAQLAALPFFPGYSVARDAASVLGTADSRHPWIFNLGAILTGAAALCGALGLAAAFRRITNILLAALIAVSVAATGVMSIKAGIFPMPDPRHATWGFLTWLTIATPLLFLLGVWNQRGGTAVRICLVASTLLIVLLLPFLMGRISTPLLQPGTVQRMLALAAFLPVGVVGFYLAKTVPRPHQ